MKYPARIILGVCTLFLCAACDQNGSKRTIPARSVISSSLTDIVLGREDAPVTMVEYANWACPACLQFHTDVMPMIKTGYIDTGKVRLIFREFPTPPVNLSVAGFAIARCVGADRYHDVLDDLFAARDRLLATESTNGDPDSRMRLFAARHGLKGKAYDTCIENRDIIYAIGDAAMKANAQNVETVPTIFINGKKLTGYDWRRAAGMKARLDAVLDDTVVE